MTDNCIQLTPDIDWGMLILEVQTAPNMDAAHEELTQLYKEIFGFLVVSARKWLISRRFSDAHDTELASLGLDKVLKEIIKFEIPDTSSQRILSSFKAWAMTCSKREWSKRIDYELNLNQDEIDEKNQEQSPSIEDILIEEENKKVSIDRTGAEILLCQEVLKKALSELPPNMRDAILEIEDSKRIDNPHARGRQGESKLIAEKYGYKQESVRTAKSRLSAKVKDRFNRERMK